MHKNYLSSPLISNCVVNTKRKKIKDVISYERFHNAKTSNIFIDIKIHIYTFSVSIILVLQGGNLLKLQENFFKLCFN